MSDSESDAVVKLGARGHREAVEGRRCFATSTTEVASCTPTSTTCSPHFTCWWTISCLPVGGGRPTPKDHRGRAHHARGRADPAPAACEGRSRRRRRRDEGSRSAEGRADSGLSLMLSPNPPLISASARPRQIRAGWPRAIAHQPPHQPLAGGGRQPSYEAIVLAGDRRRSREDVSEMSGGCAVGPYYRLVLPQRDYVHRTIATGRCLGDGAAGSGRRGCRNGATRTRRRCGPG